MVAARFRGAQRRGGGSFPPGAGSGGGSGTGEALLAVATAPAMVRSAAASRGGAGDGQFAGRSGGNGGAGFGGNGGAGGAGGARGRGGQPPPMLWYLDEKGQLAIVRVHAGLTDGQRTVIESPRIKEGMQVIVAVNTPAAANNSAATRLGAPADSAAHRVAVTSAAATAGSEREYLARARRA